MLIRSLSCLLVLLWTVSERAHAQVAKPAKVRVLLLGDSTVIGSVCRNVQPKADHLEDVVRKLLAAQADLPPVEVVNRGQDGDTIHRLLAGRYEKDVAKNGPWDFVFIRYGLNDLRGLKDFENEYPANFKKLIARLRSDFPKAEIVLETVIPYLGEENDKKINDQVRAVAKAEKLPLLDQHAPFAAELKNGPNMLSYRRLALKAVPKQFLALIPPHAIKGGTVFVMDNEFDIHLAKVPGWFADRHPNLAGYHVIGTQIAGYLAPRLRDKAKETKKSTSKRVPVTFENASQLHTLIRPHDNEWRHLNVQWLTDVVAARKKAAAEDKPLVICYTGGAGYNEPLGVC